MLELARIGCTFDVPLLANMLEGGVTPILPSKQLGELGFSMIIHGITLLMRAARTMRETLLDLKADALDPDKAGVAFEEYKALVGFGDWASVEDHFDKRSKA